MRHVPRVVCIGAATIDRSYRPTDDLVPCDAETAAIVPAFPANRIDVTGAGDALIAGTLHGLIANVPLREAVSDGVLLAALTVECEGTVHPDLSPSLLKSQRIRLEAPC